MKMQVLFNWGISVQKKLLSNAELKYILLP